MSKVHELGLSHTTVVLPFYSRLHVSALNAAIIRPITNSNTGKIIYCIILLVQYKFFPVSKFIKGPIMSRSYCTISLKAAVHPGHMLRALITKKKSTEMYY